MARKEQQEPIWENETRNNYRGRPKTAYVTQDKSWEYVVFPGRTTFEVGVNSRKNGHAYFAYNLSKGIIGVDNPQKIVENSEFILTAPKRGETIELAIIALNELEDQLKAGINPRNFNESQ